MIVPTVTPTVVPNDILDLRVQQIACTFRFELLDENFDVIGEVHPVTPVSIDHNTSSQIMRTLRGMTLTESEANNINIFKDRLRPSMVLSDGTTWPMGVFYFTSDEHFVGTAQIPLSTTLMDQAFFLNTLLPATVGVSTGKSLYDVIVAVLEVLQIERYSLEPTGATLTGSPLLWNPETTAFAILSSLASRAGFYTPYYNNDGTLVFRSASDLDTLTAHQYPLHNSRIIVNTLTTSTNLLTAPNAYKVISSGASKTVVSATEYIDSQLPHSKENRGFVITEVIRKQGLSTQSECRRIARTLAQQDPSQFATAEFVSVIDPRHDSFDAVDLGGTVSLEVGWSAQLTPGGAHRHSLVRKQIVSESE